MPGYDQKQTLKNTVFRKRTQHLRREIDEAR